MSNTARRSNHIFAAQNISLTCIRAKFPIGNMFAFSQGVQSRSRMDVAVANSGPRDPILAGVIGVIIVTVVDAYIGYPFYATKCQAPGFAQVMVLVVLAGVYLVLMYLTLKRQP